MSWGWSQEPEQKPGPDWELGPGQSGVQAMIMSTPFCEPECEEHACCAKCSQYVPTDDSFWDDCLASDKASDGTSDGTSDGEETNAPDGTTPDGTAPPPNGNNGSSDGTSDGEDTNTPDGTAPPNGSSRVRVRSNPAEDDLVKRIRVVDAAIAAQLEADADGRKRVDAIRVANGALQQLQAARMKLRAGPPGWAMTFVRTEISACERAVQEARAAQELAEYRHRFSTERARSLQRMRRQAENIFPASAVAP